VPASATSAAPLATLDPTATTRQPCRSRSIACPWPMHGCHP
jgi:hypothetical protein